MGYREKGWETDAIYISAIIGMFGKECSLRVSADREKMDYIMGSCHWGTSYSGKEKETNEVTGKTD